MWMIEIRNPAGVLINELPLARDKQFDFRLNNWGMARFTIDATDPAATPPTLHTMRNEVHIKNNNLLVWAGKLAAWRLNEQGDISCAAYSWEWLLSKFFLEDTDAAITTGYTNTDIGAIISDLIDTHQAKTGGDFGLVEGFIQTSRTATRKDYKALSDVWELVKNLTNVRNGVDFVISPNKVWSVFFPQRGQDRPGVVLDFPGNIKRLSYEEDSVDLVTKLFVKGDGIDDAAIIEPVSDAQQVGVYGLLHDSRVYSSANRDVLQEFGRGLLRERNKPQVIIDDITFESGSEGAPAFTDFNVGDTIRVNITVGNALNIYRAFRVERMTYIIDDNGALDLSVGGSYA